MCKVVGADGSLRAALPLKMTECDCDKEIQACEQLIPSSLEEPEQATITVSELSERDASRLGLRWLNIAILASFAVITLHSVHFLATQVAGRSDYDLNEASFSKALLTVWCSGWITAVTTCIGALPFFFITELNEKWVGVSNALAAGMMVSASAGLVYEAVMEKSSSAVFDPASRALIGIWTGVLFMKVSEHYVGDMDHESLLQLNSFDAKRICLVMAAMTVHSFSEGVGIGVSFHSQTLGALISTTLAIHNIPEGLALSIVLIPRGMSKIGTAIWCVLSSVPQPLMAVTAYTFVDSFRVIVPFGLGFAAGAMCYVACFELYPEARNALSATKAAIVMVAAGAFMALIQAWVSM